MFGAFGYPACLFFFAWSAGRIHWIWPTVSAVFFGWGSTLLFLGNLVYLSEAYGKYAASALASSDLCRTFVGGIMPLVSHGLFVNLGVDWGCTLLGCISVLFIPIPFVLYKVSVGFGAQTRCSNIPCTVWGCSTLAIKISLLVDPCLGDQRLEMFRGLCRRNQPDVRVCGRETKYQMASVGPASSRFE